MLKLRGSSDLFRKLVLISPEPIQSFANACKGEVIRSS